MRLLLRILTWMVGIVVLLAAIGLLFLRESLGGAYLNRYVSPTHPQNVVEVYVWEGGIGAPAFSLFVNDSGHRHFLGDLDLDDQVNWSPWNDSLSWSSDGNVLYCTDKTCRAAYVFGSQEVLCRVGLPKVNGLVEARLVSEAELETLLRAHGGEGGVFFDQWREDSSAYIWRDFLPSQNY